MSSSSLLDGRKARIFTVPGACAVALIIGITLLCHHFLHQLHDEWKMHPSAFLLLPPLTIAWLGLIVPLVVFIPHQADYNHVNPLLPSNYMFIIKKTYSAMQQNNLKVREKDL